MSKAKNTDASPMEHAFVTMPNRRNQRAYLAMTAADLTKQELVEKAKELGVDTTGAHSKEDLVEAIRSDAQPST